MAGPLQALLEEERLSREKLKERQRASVVDGYHRRSLPGGSGPRPPVNGNVRRSITPTPSSGSRSSPQLGKFSRPTTASSQKQAAGSEKRQSLATAPPAFAPPDRVEKTPELTGEQREKWDNFLHRSSVQLQEKEKYLDMLRKKKESRDMQACSFAPEISKASRSIRQQGTMLDRQREMEARKAQKLKQLRQEQFDKEMSQCSFKPTLSRRATEERGMYSNSRRSGGSHQTSMGTPSFPAFGMRGGAHNGIHLAEYEEDYEGSEYWDDDDDNEYPVQDIENGREVAETTLLPPSSNGREEKALPKSIEVAPLRDDDDAEDDTQFKVLQRLQERKQSQQAAALTSKSPGVQGLSAALRKSVAGRKSQILGVTELPTPSFGSTENELMPRSAPKAGDFSRASVVAQLAGDFSRASVSAQLVDNESESMEGFLHRHSASQSRRVEERETMNKDESEASDADSPVLGGDRH